MTNPTDKQAAVEAALAKWDNRVIELIDTNGRQWTRSDRVFDLIDEIRAILAEPRPCTCHPDDNPPVPCPRKYALSECRAAAPSPTPAPTGDEPDGMAALAIGVAEQRWPHTMDARVWVKEWMETLDKHPAELPRDEGVMIGWFANAIMAGYDTATLRARPNESAEPRGLPDSWDRDLTDAEIVSACFSQDHSYGLLDKGSQAAMRYGCREWWKAIRKELRSNGNPNLHPMVADAITHADEGMKG